MQTREYKGGKVSVWRRSDGRTEISISCSLDDDWLDDAEIEGTEHGPCVGINLTMEQMADLIEWLDEMACKHAA